MKNPKENIDILFIDGLNRESKKLSYLGYLFPLAAELERYQYTFKILNLHTQDEYNLSNLINQLNKINVKTIGMTTNADNIANVYKVCEAIKQYNPLIQIILGGPQVTYSDIETLTKCNCDIVVRNMGEKSLIEVMDSIYRNGLELSDIKGISFKVNDEIKKNEDHRFLDINSFATPQYAILSDEKYWIIPQNGKYKNFNSFLSIIVAEYNYILTGRGCPFRCAFCVEGNSKNKYVYRSLPNLKNDLRYFLSITKAKYIAFADDTFTSSPKRVSELCSMIKETQKEFYNFIWFAEGRVDILSKHLEMIGIMYDAGLRKLQLGIESGRQETLNIYNKGINLDQIERVIKESSKYEYLTVYGNIMMANPQESFSDFLPTIDFFEKLLELSDFKFDIGLSYLAPFVGTPIRLNPQKYGIDILIKDFEFKASAMENVICKSYKMTLSEVHSLRQIAHARILFYCKNKIFKMPANKIINLFKIAMQSYSNVIILSIFNLLPSFSRYFTFAISKESIFVDNQNDYINYCPLRLWDLEYTPEIGYSFTDLDGEKSTLKDIDKQLWEFASGKNTVSDIYQIMNYNKMSFLEIDYILSFYRSLENKLALLFRKY